MDKSNIKFLVDVGVGKKDESFLRESDYDIKSIIHTTNYTNSH